jgi:5-methyltetrahydrofolate--homocysteine methyltransferase
VGIVLGCNNYEIIDLGVMVPAEKILAVAKEKKVDIIGLSGLITPSLEEMMNIAKEMERQGFDIPLLIGGATTSKIHTAVKIEPEYTHPVIHVKDASKSVPVVSNLLNREKRDDYIYSVKNEYDDLRNSYKDARTQIEYLSLDEARLNALQVNWPSLDIKKPAFTGVKTYLNYPLEEIREYISWMFFFVVWELRGKFPEILDHPKMGKEASRLYEDANRMLDSIIEEKWLTANAVLGFFPANSVGDDIEVYEDETREKVLTRFINLRNQNKKTGDTPNLCLSDFIAPRESGIIDYIGAFAVTAGIGAEKKVQEFEKANDDYSSIMLKALADRLAEAFTELLHLRVRTELWGYSREEEIDLEGLLLEKYKGIRPAFGYPACPDHSEKETLFRLLDATAKSGISLTDNYSMYPAASVSGLMFQHPFTKYFHVGKISEDQVRDYAIRKGMDINTIEIHLASNLNYKL